MLKVLNGTIRQKSYSMASWITFFFLRVYLNQQDFLWLQFLYCMLYFCILHFSESFTLVHQLNQQQTCIKNSKLAFSAGSPSLQHIDIYISAMRIHKFESVLTWARQSCRRIQRCNVGRVAWLYRCGSLKDAYTTASTSSWGWCEGATIAWQENTCPTWSFPLWQSAVAQTTVSLASVKWHNRSLSHSSSAVNYK